jgi:uncharacterized protein
MANDMKWIWMGSGQWSKTFDGKKAILEQLWAAVKTTLVTPFKATANHIIADEDYVAVEAGGQNKTPGGKKYENKYCWICRIREGKLHELREYMDTDLVSGAFNEQT